MSDEGKDSKIDVHIHYLKNLQDGYGHWQSEAREALDYAVGVLEAVKKMMEEAER